MLGVTVGVGMVGGGGVQLMGDIGMFRAREDDGLLQLPSGLFFFFHPFHIPICTAFTSICNPLLSCCTKGAVLIGISFHTKAMPCSCFILFSHVSLIVLSLSCDSLLTLVFLFCFTYNSFLSHSVLFKLLNSQS